MVRRSTSTTVSHACNVPAVNASGSPEANPKGSITAIRRFLKLANDENRATRPHAVLMVIQGDTRHSAAGPRKKRTRKRNCRVGTSCLDRAQQRWPLNVHGLNRVISKSTFS